MTDRRVILIFYGDFFDVLRIYARVIRVLQVQLDGEPVNICSFYLKRFIVWLQAI